MASEEFSAIPTAVQLTELCNVPRLEAQPSTTSLIISASTTENADNFNLNWNAVLNASSYDVNINLPENHIFFGTLPGITNISLFFTMILQN